MIASAPALPLTPPPARSAAPATAPHDGASDTEQAPAATSFDAMVAALAPESAQTSTAAKEAATAALAADALATASRTGEAPSLDLKKTPGKTPAPGGTPSALALVDTQTTSPILPLATAKAGEDEATPDKADTPADAETGELTPAVIAALVAPSPAPSANAPKLALEGTAPAPVGARAARVAQSSAAPGGLPHGQPQPGGDAAFVVQGRPGEVPAPSLAGRAAAPATPPVFDIEALFPGGGDRPLSVTFPRDGQLGHAAAATVPPALPTPATPIISAAAIAQAAEAAAVQPKGDAARGDDKGALDGARALPAPAPLPSAATLDPASGLRQPVSAEAVVFRQHLDLARDGAWLDSLARDIAKSADGDSRLSFRLNPAHLGSLHVELTNGADGTAIRLITDTDAARAILADSRHHLMAEARAQGLRVADARIDVAGSGGQGTPMGGGHHGGSQPRTAGAQQDLLTILPHTRPDADAGARAAPARERYA
jgi:hypothetical protein